MVKGWFKDSWRHSLSSRGIVSSRNKTKSPNLTRRKIHSKRKQGNGFIWFNGRMTPARYRAEKDTLNFTPESLKEFDAELKKAKGLNKDQFVFQGKDVLVSYGEYLSEYLHNQMRD